MNDHGTSCCDTTAPLSRQYTVESVVSIDERGQMVLPKEIREKMNIRPGEKMALVIMEKDGCPCCITLIKANELASMVQSMIDPTPEAGQIGR
jgi:AbrB family looped-hinge helix DNA binding protein